MEAGKAAWMVERERARAAGREVRAPSRREVEDTRRGSEEAGAIITAERGRGRRRGGRGAIAGEQAMDGELGEMGHGGVFMHAGER